MLTRAWALACALLVGACASPQASEAPAPAPGMPGSAGAGMGYRFASSRSPIRTPEAQTLAGQYPGFFAVLDTSYASEDADVRTIRADLVHDPANLRSYDALNAVAAVFFELHKRAEQSRRGGSASGSFLATNFRATKVMAVPWRAYGDVSDARLRCAILDFYEDLLFGSKAGMGPSRGRFTSTVESLLKWETDPEIRARIEDLVVRSDAKYERSRRP